MHVYSMCVSECMCISNMIHLWWIKPAVSIEQWPRTPCTRGKRRCKRPVSTELPNIAWPSTDHCAMLSTEVTIGQIRSNNNGITLCFFFNHKKPPAETQLKQMETRSSWMKTSYDMQGSQNPPKCLHSDSGFCCVCDTRSEVKMILFYFTSFTLISYDITTR